MSNTPADAQRKATEIAAAVAPKADVITWPLDKDFLQKNIDRSVDFRKEYYKYSLGISTALLAFTVSFPPNLSTISCPSLIFIAWAGLGFAVVGGVLAHDLWSRFFITWRNYDNRGNSDRGDEVRDRITWWRRKADVVQLVGLGIGVAGIVAFASVNIPNIAPKESKGATTSSTAISTTAPPATQTPGQAPPER
jgi:hypothetical protein